MRLKKITLDFSTPLRYNIFMKDGKNLMQKITPPAQCPSCSSNLIWRNDTLCCVSDNCGSKSVKAIEHWAKTLKIKGLGIQSIIKLELDSVVDLYELTPEYINSALGSEKLGSKLLDEIQKSTEAKLNQVLPAFGIPLIGGSATEKLCKVITHLDELTEAKAATAGLGPKARENLMSWYTSSYSKLKSVLPFDFEVESKQYKPSSSKGVVCISGKLNSFKTKAEAAKVLEDNGYVVKSSMSKEVTHLINESGIESAKTAKARESGIAVITNLKTLLEN